MALGAVIDAEADELPPLTVERDLGAARQHDAAPVSGPGAYVQRAQVLAHALRDVLRERIRFPLGWSHRDGAALDDRAPALRGRMQDGAAKGLLHKSARWRHAEGIRRHRGVGVAAAAASQAQRKNERANFGCPPGRARDS